MMNKKLLINAMANRGGGAQTIDDVFSTYLYAGNGASQDIVNGIDLKGTPTAVVDQTILDSFSTTLYTGNTSTQDIVTGQDLAADGGMVWCKVRSGTFWHEIHDTERGIDKRLIPHENNAENTGGAVDVFNSDGFSFSGQSNINRSGESEVAWTFKKQPKFFDVVTYTGNGTGGRTVPHSLGITPGMIIVKSISEVGDWYVYHISNGNAVMQRLNTTNGLLGGEWNNTSPTDAEFTLGSGGANTTSVEYVAYLYAHDDAADGIIQCGTFNMGASQDTEVTLGWQPQYLLFKTSSYSDNWLIFDTERGITPEGSNDPKLYANASFAEDTGNNISLTATGFKMGAIYTANSDIIYMAIRKPQYSGGDGMVWLKSRSHAEHNFIFDTARGAGQRMLTNGTAAESLYLDMLAAFNADGVSLGDNVNTNGSSKTFAAWTFKKAPKFFDVVTYTGDGIAGRTVPHDLGSVPGMMLVKCTSAAEDWQVYHRSEEATRRGRFNTTDAFTTLTATWNNVEPTDAEFTVGDNGITNGNGATYVAYLFGHDTDPATGMIQCGIYTGNGNITAGPEINLTWEPQYLLIKNSSSAQDWVLLDTLRGIVSDGDDSYLNPNLTAAEIGSETRMSLTATGFKLNTNHGSLNVNGDTYIYMAIRGPMMKEPTDASEVFDLNFANAVAPSFRASFPADMVFHKQSTVADSWANSARLIAGKQLVLNTTASEVTMAAMAFDYMDGWYSSAGVPSTYLGYSFKRAKGFFDVAVYTGDGVAGHNIPHSLGVPPQLIIVKNRELSSGAWRVYHEAMGNGGYLSLNGDASKATNVILWNNTTPTDSVFTLGTYNNVNGSNDGHVAYLFATLAGISKVGSYTGNGTSLTLDCGFSAGARFVLIKRTNSTGDWFMWDTARGIVAGNDPHLTLNTTAAEVTSDDSIDPDSSGFIVNELAATNINVSAATYIFLAIA